MLKIIAAASAIANNFFILQVSFSFISECGFRLGSGKPKICFGL